MSTPKQKKKSAIIIKIIAAILLLAAAACIGIAARLYTQYRAGLQEMQDLRAQVQVAAQEPSPQITEPATPSPDPTPEPSAVPDEESTLDEASSVEQPIVTEAEEEAEPPRITCSQTIDFAAAQQTNQDIYAWITVPGVGVDHPVLQSVVDEYYLLRNLDGSEGYPGCLYTNRSANKQDFSDYITVIYGHNMPTRLMFTGLLDLQEDETFAQCRSFTVYTRQQRLTYEVLAAVWYSDDSIPYYYDTSSFDGATAFWNSVLTECDFYNEPSHIVQDAVLQDGDKLCVLSTCIRKNGSILKGRRYLVIGRLIETAYVTE